MFVGAGREGLQLLVKKGGEGDPLLAQSGMVGIRAAYRNEVAVAVGGGWICINYW